MTKEMMYACGLLILMAVLGAIVQNSRKSTKKSSNTKSDSFSYQKRTSLLTASELSCYRELLRIATAKGLAVFAKVRIADILEPKKGSGNWQTAFNKIAAKHVDFVLCNKEMKPVLLVELDDPSHDRSDRQERDTFVDQAMESAKMPILHIRDTKDLAQKLSKAIAS